VPKSRGVMAAAFALGALGIGGVVFVATRGPESKAVAPAASGIHVTTPVATTSSSAAPAVSLVAAPGAWTAVAPPPRPERLEPASNTPSVPVSALAPLRPPPHPATPGAAAPLTAAPPSAPNKPSCNPPYEFDENGNKRWKRECL
jgi:hypothetical protein